MRDVLARAEGATLWLGVWEENPRAIAFYAKWSFVVVGQKTFLVGDDPQTDHVMQRSP
jgi:ribosomal protein S18 acetylase RimI-like enzyme